MHMIATKNFVGSNEGHKAIGEPFEADNERAAELQAEGVAEPEGGGKAKRKAGPDETKPSTGTGTVRNERTVSTRSPLGWNPPAEKKERSTASVGPKQNKVMKPKQTKQAKAARH